MEMFSRWKMFEEAVRRWKGKSEMEMETHCEERYSIRGFKEDAQDRIQRVP